MNFGNFYRFCKYRGALEGIHIIKIIPLDTGYFIFLDFKISVKISVYFFCLVVFINFRKIHVTFLSKKDTK